MALVVVDQGEEQLLDLILAVTYEMKLFTNDVTTGLTDAQIDALDETDFTEATFTGYTDVTLTGGAWTTTQGNPSSGTYAQQSFTSSANQTPQVIYGYYVVRASDGELVWFEYLPGPITIENNGDEIEITPTFTLDDDAEATVTARGVLAYQQLTSNSSGYTADATSDFSLTNIEVDSTRMYKIGLSVVMNFTAASSWFVNLHVGGVAIMRVAMEDPTAPSNVLIDWQGLWTPDTGTYDLDIRVDEQSGSATLTFAASSAAPRQFWIEDVGPR